VVASPIPDEAPVMKTVFPVNELTVRVLSDKSAAIYRGVGGQSNELARKEWNWRNLTAIPLCKIGDLEWAGPVQTVGWLPLFAQGK
jgi:hypothetical protein